MIHNKNAIILHLYYLDLWEEFKLKLVPILDLGDCDLYITITDESFKETLQELTPNVYVVQNKGMDIGPLLIVLEKIKNLNYNAIFKIHSKKSIHHGQSESFGQSWRNLLVDSIIGSVETYNNISGYIKNNPISMCGAKSYYYDFKRDAINIPYHYGHIKESLQYMNIEIKEERKMNSVCFGNNGNFFAGTMFATSHDYYKKIFSKCDINKLYESFPIGYSKLTTAHALERILGYYINECDGTFVLIS